MVFENTIRYRPVQPAQAGLAPVACGFGRRTDEWIAEYVYKNHSCRGVQQSAGALRAKALAEDLKAPLGLLANTQSASTTCLPVRVDRCALHNERSNIVSD